MVNVTYTIYADRRPTVGITFPPTPNLTYAELLNLISRLNRIEREMRS